MNEIKYFNPGQFISKRALISSVIGIALAVVTEWLIPFLGIMPKFTDWITPAVILFTISIIAITSAIAKNVIASIVISLSASLCFYSPIGNYTSGYISIVVIYLSVALFTGIFATIEMSGKTALTWIGIVFGLQAILGAAINMLLYLTNSFQTYYANGVYNISLGNPYDSFPFFDLIVMIVGLIYMVVFILLGRRVHSSSIENKIREIIGQIIIFLALAATLAINIMFNETFTQETATQIIGEDNLLFINHVFQKTTSDNLAVFTLLNGFYVLPIAGMIIGIGLALIVYQRAQGTTGTLTFDFEGSYFALNIPLAFVLGIFSYYWYQLNISEFYLNMETWYVLATIYTNLLLINLIVVFILALVLRPFLGRKK
ncbi:MAG: hypothetical protein K9W46_06270 [Candidatus Heimdallarchaeum endolithica]|uniref:Uncharacterized protein n=1 Tax=Candidatus Heimdallarchaeum endolithica TaxID=2876572 RepID=A0A9Y1BTC7_9ARCH|nr:MAG: hypothetical protein K9W46_06270 [Candidatus Heimdallarchaeum endolithica]